MPLRVEPLDSQTLSISDVALNGTLRDAPWLMREAAEVSPAPLVPAPLVSKQAQFIPAADARLPKKSSLPLYFEIYEPLLTDRSPEVSFRMKITDLKDGSLVVNAGPTSAAQSVIPGNVVIPIALKGVKYRPVGADALLRRNLLIWGVGGVIAPFIGIKLIDLIMVGLHMVA